MITRKNYRAVLKNRSLLEADLQKLLCQDEMVVKKAIEGRKCLTVAMYRHEGMLFLYYEALEEITPRELFPTLSEQLALWPQTSGDNPWAYMYPIYYHSIPESVEEWEIHRGEKKIRRGRIAYLLEEKMFSYTYHHQAIVEEGLFEGDQYQFISLHENVLFSYFEEPKHFTHIKKELGGESVAIHDWIAVDPESHFDHTLSGEENFLMLPEVFSMGKEDVDR